MLPRGPSFACDRGVVAIAGTTTARWATIARSMAAIRDRASVVATVAIPRDHAGAVALDAGVLAIGRQRYDLAARGWLASPLVEAAVLREIHASHPTADIDQLRVEAAGWQADRLIAQLCVRPPRDDRRWNADAPAHWLVALEADRCTVLASGQRALEPGELAIAGARCATVHGAATLWSRTRPPRVLTREPMRACAFADHGRALCAAALAGPVLAWDVESKSVLALPHGAAGPPADRLAGHPRLPLIAWQTGRRLAIAVLDSGAHGELALDDGALLVGWDAVEPLVFVSRGDELASWRWR